MNRIGTIRFDFQMQDEVFARNLYGRWDSFFTTCFEPVADKVLNRYSPSGEQIEIDRLELDLGSISEEEFDDRFPLRLCEQLEEALSKCLYDAAEQQRVKRISRNKSAFQLLCGFLLDGTLSWTAADEYKDIYKLFYKVLQENSLEFKQFLQTYGHYTSLQQRLVYQLNDSGLEKGVRLLAPGAGEFIISYVRLLHARYKELEQPVIAESDYHRSVWQVVYAYLLTRRSSYFDKKSFIAQTILQLAAKYNLSYKDLLSLLTRELSAFREKFSIPLELFRILEVLQKELSEKLLEESFVDAAKFYKIVSGFIRKGLSKQISGESSTGLIRILAHPHSCRMFLQCLDEAEIIRLVPLVIPQESDFVIEVARSLDRQKEQGALQGKAGGGFRLLKWQIIFPVLLEKRESRFNRKQFVYSVLKQVAAHYNLEVRLVLEYFIRDSELLPRADKELKGIFTALFEELTLVSPRIKEKKPASQEERLHLVLNAVASSGIWTPQQINQILQLLSDCHFRKKVMDYTHEPERFRMIELLYPREQEFILSYVQSLDKLYEYSPLQAKAGGHFVQVKWMFLFTVFSEMPEDRFNRRSFVGRVLQQVAAHYNLSYFDLLLYFRQEQLVVYLPFRLEQLLDELYREEQQHLLEIISQSGKEEDKNKYISCFPGIDAGFVKNYMRVLDLYHDKRKLQGKVSGDFKILKWHFVFAVLLESRNMGFNKKQFVRHSLLKIAGHYNLSLQDVLSWLCTGTQSFTQHQFEEIIHILNELHQEQSQPARKPDNLSSVDLVLKCLPDNPVGEKEQNLVEKLSEQTGFIRYAVDILQLLPDLQKFILLTFKIRLTNKEVLGILLQVASGHSSLSRAGILYRILEAITVRLSVRQKDLLVRSAEKWCKSQTLQLMIIQTIKQKMMKSEEKIENAKLDSQFVSNAGMVLLSSYLPLLFSRLNLTEGNRFRDKDAQIRAMFLMHFAVFKKTESLEHEMILDKLLTGYQTAQPVPRNLDLTDEEKSIVESLLKGTLQNWPKLKNTSITVFREAFLQRNGKLEEKDDFIQLTVEEKAYDMLLDSVTWNFRIIKFPWMRKMIQVKWR
ncbi:MAG: hypothetical protein LBU57_07740 [Dysgonamonadaceae bacterium]|jgi:hypothetical protein|nr:hypothetical protein [Dysgonamonadaceae bacterium]